MQWDVGTMTARLLKLKDAAEYCGLPPRNFRKHIGISPVRLGPHELWDRVKLDAYIDALQGDNLLKNGEDWTDAVKKF
jgi:hypothetical protein